MDIKVKYHYDDLPRLQMTDKGDWVDLYTAEDVIITNPVEFQLVNLGVSIELPEGYEANIVPRSSTYKNWNVLQSNHFGVVDEIFKGDNDVWKFPLLFVLTNQSIIDEMNDQLVIPKHTRLCQFRINKKQPKLNFIEVEHLGNEDRKGFGSSGL
jgi:dUTP pyrophosphatase